MASRTLLQMDQATLAYQKVLRDLCERGEDANLDCRVRLRPRCDSQKITRLRPDALQQSKVCKRLDFRENAYHGSTYD
jgi:hypothetical protein